MNNQKVLLSILAVLLVIGFVYFYSDKYSNRPVDYVLQDATIKEVKEGSLVLEGSLRSLDGKIFENKIIEFHISSETRLIKNVKVITKEQTGSKGEFTPTLEVRAGSISDFVVGGPGIVYAKGDKNLFARDEVNALEIKYMTYEVPKPSK